jgi:sigma-B regulation protein RsbU (phosphoserine phosphatase)
MLRKISFFEVEGLVKEQRLPGILTRTNDDRQPGDATDGGIVIAPANSTNPIIAAILRAVWSQARTIDDLRTEINFLQTQSGGLCDQIHKIDEELRLAAQLQQEFLPQSLPKLGDVNFDVLFRPAGYVSGDIYDVLRLDESHIGFFLADAVGHGVPAALMTMYIKRSLLTKEVDPTSERGYRIVPPAESLAKLNHDMCEQNDINEDSKIRFATACYGVINCKTLEIEYASAGHPYPMIMRSNGQIDTIKPEGAMLGVFPEEEFETATTQLQPGDRFLIFSDGFEVAFPESDDNQGHLASEQYIEEFKDLANGSPKDALARLEDKLDNQAGSLNQIDDMTIVCLGVKAQPAAAALPLEEPIIHAKAG